MSDGVGDRGGEMERVPGGVRRKTRCEEVARIRCEACNRVEEYGIVWTVRISWM